MTHPVEQRALAQMMDEFHRQYAIAQKKANNARLKAGQILKGMRTKVESDGGDWWQWFTDNSVRSRKDAEKLLRLAESDDPEAAADEAAEANRNAVSRLRKREKEFPVERIRKLIGKLTPEQRNEFETSRPPPVTDTKPEQALPAAQSANDRKAMRPLKMTAQAAPPRPGSWWRSTPTKRPRQVQTASLLLSTKLGVNRLPDQPSIWACPLVSLPIY